MDAVIYYGLLAAGFGAMWWQHARRARLMPRLGTRFAEDADIALHVARHAAKSRDHDITTNCVLYGLLQDERIVNAIGETGGDAEAIEDRVLAALDDGADDQDVVPIIQWLLAVASAQKRQVTCIDLWSGLAQHAPAPTLLVGEGGVSAAEVLFTLVHGIAEKDVPWPASGRVQVTLINDDISTQELVVDILREVFGRDSESATALMWTVHNEGRGPIDVYDSLEAKALVAAARDRARLEGFPLWIKAERE